MHTAPAPSAPGLDVDAWARHAMRSLTAITGVHRAGVSLTEGGGRRLRFTASDRVADGAPVWCHVDAYDDVPLNTVVRTGAQVVGSLDDLAERYPAFVERQRPTATVALAAAPLHAAGQTLGGFVLFFDTPQAFGGATLSAVDDAARSLAHLLRQAQRGSARPEPQVSAAGVPPGARVAVHDVPPDPTRVREARLFLRTTLAGWGVGTDTVAAAELCLSELVTNALVHTHAGCSVRLLLDRGVLTTSVRDSGRRGGSHTPAPQDEAQDPLQVHGRGLQLVESLSSRWGSDLDSTGTTVWFVLDV